MKKIISLIIIILFLFHIESNSQTYKEVKTNIELPRLKIKNKKLQKGLGSELIKNNKEWNPSYVYSLLIEEGKESELYKLTVTITTICDINKLAQLPHSFENGKHRYILLNIKYIKYINSIKLLFSIFYLPSLKNHEATMEYRRT